MQEKIGNVTLDYTYYKGTDLYTDGEIENVILDAVKRDEQQTLLHNSNDWAVLYHISDIREGIIDWYPFEEDADVLEIGSGCGAITGLLSRKAGSVTCIELSKKRSLINAYRNKEKSNIKIIIGNFQDIKIDRKFDYITLIGVWEYAGLYVDGSNPYIKMLEQIRHYLKPNGKIIVAIENKMGLKYWNGAPEDHTGKLYSGLNDYISERNVRTFSKVDIENMLKELGIEEYSFYYPMPDYKLPSYIYSDRMFPEPGSLRFYRQDYCSSRLYNFYDATVYDQVCSDKIFPYFANSFLLICGDKGSNCMTKYSRLRKKRFRVVTNIIENKSQKITVKSALSDEATEHILQQKANEGIWAGTLPRIKCVPGEIKDNSYCVSYIEGITVDAYLYKWRNNEERLAEKVKEIIERFLMPERSMLVPFKMSDMFETIFGNVAPEEAYSLKVTNIDLVFSNLKFYKDELFNFDYEWVFNFAIPYEYVLWRAVTQLYDEYAIYLKNAVSKKDFCVKTGITLKNIPIYELMEKNFSSYVFGENKSENYLKNFQKSSFMQNIRFI